MRIAIALTFGLCASLSAQGESDRVKELHAVLTARMRTEADVAERVKRCREWLVAVRDLSSPRIEFLRFLAGYYATTAKPERRSHLDALAAWLNKYDDRLLAPGFRGVVGRMLLWYGVALTNAGEFEAAVRELPRILGFQDDRRSAFWLMGRRGRDHGTDAGRKFLEQTIVPAILADHALDDTDRVYLLRRLYSVAYTGPKPFHHIAGPIVAGGRVSSADLDGDVVLVMYWATW
ncbi:MAG: hypothetical protein CMJ83_03070 [Planctomycetes bacterium]|jgi:hypothetical protein|nr:hypothetical protein [Planctomycetota bacterium]